MLVFTYYFEVVLRQGRRHEGPGRSKAEGGNINNQSIILVFDCITLGQPARSGAGDGEAIVQASNHNNNINYILFIERSAATI
jgi:hypothetical protein